MKRALILIGFMVFTGFAANRALAAFQTHGTSASLVNTTSPQIRLSGTIFVSQDGAIYAISGSSVRRLPLPAGGDWSQPRVLPDGSLLVIRRFDEYSDMYHVSAAGKVLSQMTDNDQSTRNKNLQLDHWVIYPQPVPTVRASSSPPTRPSPRQVRATRWTSHSGRRR